MQFDLMKPFGTDGFGADDILRYYITEMKNFIRYWRTFLKHTLRGKCLNTDQKKLRIRTFFTQ